MRTQSTLLFFVIAAMLSSVSYAQDSQYKRAKKSKKDAASESVAAPAGKESDKKDADKKEVKKTSEEKVDISDLEQKYWAPKDVEFNVVQNRLYSKAGRFGLTPSIGPLVTDSFSSGSVLGLSANYYFSERYGIEASYSKYNLKDSSVTEGFISSNGTTADFNRQTYFYGVSFNWVPIYAKLSLLEKKILYFDMSISPGIGVMGYEQQVASGAAPAETSPTITLDIAQHYFLSKEFAFRIDMRNRFYNDKVIKYRTQEPVKEKGNHSVAIQFGITYYFGFGGSK